MRKILWIVCVAAMLPGTQAAAQEGTFGAGGFFEFYIPLFNFRDMYGNGAKYGGTVHYAYADRQIAEVEYHHARFKDGSLERRTFTFSGDGNDYVSPQARARMTFNSIHVNWLFAIKEQGFGQGAVPYITFGTGLHHYSSKVSGLVYAAQTPSGASASPDLTQLQEPVADTRTAYSASFGGGLMFGLGEKAAIDVRTRYNIVFGELRPFLAWGIEKTFPFNLIDVGVGLKFNLN